MQNYKLCINCRHHYEGHLPDRLLPSRFCERIIGQNLVTGQDIYLGTQCHDERIDGISRFKILDGTNIQKCGVEARYFEPKS